MSEIQLNDCNSEGTGLLSRVQNQFQVTSNNVGWMQYEILCRISKKNSKKPLYIFLLKMIAHYQIVPGDHGA